MGESIRVLYVDDDPARGPTVESLEREDDRLEVVTESSPGDALARLRSDPTAADCVVSDYDVPGMTGVEFVERIRARFPGRSLPIVLFTSERSEEVAANALNAGAAGYVPKGEPDSVDRLVERIVGGAADPHAGRESDRDGTLPDALADPGYVLDEEGTFVDVNDGFADLVGDDRESLVGADLDRVADAEAAATIETNLARVRSEDGPDVVRFEAEIVPKRGDRVVTEHRVESVSDGRVRGSTDILRSATARRDLKHRIERLRDATGSSRGPATGTRSARRQSGRSPTRWVIRRAASGSVTTPSPSNRPPGATRGTFPATRRGTAPSGKRFERERPVSPGAPANDRGTSRTRRRSRNWSFRWATTG